MSLPGPPSCAEIFDNPWWYTWHHMARQNESAQVNPSETPENHVFQPSSLDQWPWPSSLSERLSIFINPATKFWARSDRQKKDRRDRFCLLDHWPRGNNWRVCPAKYCISHFAIQKLFFKQLPTYFRKPDSSNDVAIEILKQWWMQHFKQGFY